ncbi:hypothetical protein HFD88_003195 [Aspergillus terreus]|nr:hypothetical protein HFD88_003195 [Aspergillus terreus]
MHFTGLFFLAAATSALGAAVTQPTPTPSAQKSSAAQAQASSHPPNVAAADSPALCGPHGPGNVGGAFKLYAEDEHAHVTHIQAYLTPFALPAPAGLTGLQVTFSNGETKSAGITEGIARSCVVDQRVTEVAVRSAGFGVSQLVIRKEDETVCALGYETGVSNACSAEVVGDGVLAGLEGRAAGMLSSLGVAFL